MSIWAILTFVCDFFKLSQYASSFWARHEQHEAHNISDADDKLGDSYVIARLRSKYGREA